MNIGYTLTIILQVTSGRRFAKWLPKMLFSTDPDWKSSVSVDWRHWRGQHLDWAAVCWPRLSRFWCPLGRKPRLRCIHQVAALSTDGGGRVEILGRFTSWRGRPWDWAAVRRLLAEFCRRRCRAGRPRGQWLGPGPGTRGEHCTGFPSTAGQNPNSMPAPYMPPSHCNNNNSRSTQPSIPPGQ